MKERLPYVVISIVNWNGKADTLACLDSLQQVDYPERQIILVDNGSTDGTVEAVRRAFPDVRLICNRENLRYARANNQAITLALQQGADYVLLLNNDTRVAPDFLTHLVARAESDSRIGMVGAKIYYEAPGQRIWYAGGRVSLWRGKIWHVGLRRPDAGQYDEATEVEYITGCCLLASRQCIETVGLLDEDFYMYAEDVDWCYRARRAGFRLMYEPRAKVWHKISSSTGGQQTPGGLTPFKVRHKIQGMLLFFRKWARWYQWPTILIFMSLEFVRTLLLILWERNWRAFEALIKAPFLFKRK